MGQAFSLDEFTDRIISDIQRFRNDEEPKVYESIDEKSPERIFEIDPIGRSAYILGADKIILTVTNPEDVPLDEDHSKPDKRTGKPLRGAIEAYIADENPHEEKNKIYQVA